MADMRFDDEESAKRMALMCQQGQPVLLKTEVLNESLVVVVTKPQDGFIHLVQDPQACLDEYGEYHMSICQRELVTHDMLHELRSRWDGVAVTLPIQRVGGWACMEIAECPLTQDHMIQRRHGHKDAWYKDRPFFILAGERGDREAERFASGSQERLVNAIVAV